MTSLSQFFNDAVKFSPDLPPKEILCSKPVASFLFCFFFINVLVTPVAAIVLKLHNPPAKIGNIFFISKSFTWSQSRPYNVFRAENH